MKKWAPNWNQTPYKGNDNNWAGAKKACDNIGMSLPDTSKLQSLAKKTAAEKEQLGLPTSGWWLLSSGSGHYYACFIVGGCTYDDGKSNVHNGVLCVGD